MNELLLALGIGALVLGALCVVAATPWGRRGCVRFLRWRQQGEAEAALQRFRIDREQLEARFFQLASNLGRPRGLRWIDCDWLPDVAFARDTESGMLTAFVAVNIRFEAIEGGDMDDVEAVGTVRDAAAVFHFHRGRWGTGGRALFNMNPQDAVARLAGQYDPVAAGS